VSQLKLLFRVPKNVQGAELSMDATKDVMIDKSSTSCADAPTNVERSDGEHQQLDLFQPPMIVRTQRVEPLGQTLRHSHVYSDEARRGRDCPAGMEHG